MEDDSTIIKKQREDGGRCEKHGVAPNKARDVIGYSHANDREDQDSFVTTPHRIGDDGSQPRGAVDEEGVELR